MLVSNILITHLWIIFIKILDAYKWNRVLLFESLYLQISPSLEAENYHRKRGIGILSEVYEYKNISDGLK